MSRILVLDDDPHILRTLEIMLRNDKHEVLCFATGEEALARLEGERVDVALVDLQLPGMSGLEFLKKVRDLHRDIDVVIITAYGTIESAVDAIREGAFDYLTKPFSPQQVRHRLHQIEDLRRLRAEVAGLRMRLGEGDPSGFASRSPAVLHMIEIARTVAESEATVLIAGESGVGKNRLARLIHQWSPRRDGPFVVVDCTSFQESLLESELFGHKRGAFTGAIADKQGKVETAQNGSILLDEVGEIPPHLQGKLLRLVEEKTFERVGDPNPRTMDTRIVAATNRNLEEMVREKSFRQDLFYRLGVVELHIPALRHRPEDIPLLTRLFITQFNREHARTVDDVAPETERLLIAHSWPGNVRELANVLERAVLLAPGKTIRPDHLPPRLCGSGVAPGVPGEILPLAAIEENHIRQALASGLPLEEISSRLGIDPSTLWRKRKRYNI